MCVCVCVFILERGKRASTDPASFFCVCEPESSGVHQQEATDDHSHDELQTTATKPGWSGTQRRSLKAHLLTHMPVILAPSIIW